MTCQFLASANYACRCAECVPTDVRVDQCPGCDGTGVEGHLFGESVCGVCDGRGRASAARVAALCGRRVELGLAERVTGQIAARVIRAGARVARVERRVRAWLGDVLVAFGLFGEES